MHIHMNSAKDNAIVDIDYRNDMISRGMRHMMDNVREDVYYMRIGDAMIVFSRDGGRISAYDCKLLRAGSCNRIDLLLAAD